MGILSMHNGYPEHAEHVICSCVCTREDALHLEYTHTEYTHTECAHMQSAHTRTHAHFLPTALLLHNHIPTVDVANLGKPLTVEEVHGLQHLASIESHLFLTQPLLPRRVLGRPVPYWVGLGRRTCLGSRSKNNKHVCACLY